MKRFRKFSPPTCADSQFKALHGTSHEEKATEEICPAPSQQLQNTRSRISQLKNYFVAGQTSRLDFFLVPRRSVASSVGNYPVPDMTCASVMERYPVPARSNTSTMCNFSATGKPNAPRPVSVLFRSLQMQARVYSFFTPSESTHICPVRFNPAKCTQYRTSALTVSRSVYLHTAQCIHLAYISRT